VNYYFSFAAETPANENQHAFGKFYIAFLVRKGWSLFLFARSAKMNRKKILCVLCASNERSEWAVKLIL